MKSIRFLDPEQVLFRAGLNKGMVVVDMGAGSGFFAIASSKISGDSGKVYVIDVLDTALDHVMAEARLNNLKNLETIKHNLEKDTTPGVDSGIADLVIATNICHQVKKLENLFTEAYRMLKTGGKLLVIDWNQTRSPIGPKLETRVPEEVVEKAAAKSNLKLSASIETDPYHFALTFIK